MSVQRTGNFGHRNRELSSCRSKCPVGSEPRAASGRTSKANEWQRSKFRERIASKKFRAPQQDTCRQKKAPTFRSRLFVFALPIFTASHPATIVGVHVLNFCVRDGNRWTHMTINTNSILEEVFPFLFSKLLSADVCYSPLCNLSFGIGDPYRIRTDVNGVRGRCLNHLTNGPLVHLQGLEPGTH